MRYSILSIVHFTFFILHFFVAAAGDYIPPVKSKRGFSGMFGEIRSNHLHSGLDYRIEKLGEPVYAIANGYIERINVRPNGFGLAIYVNHPTTGISSVYAHLDGLPQEMAKYVKQLQYERKSFSVDISLPPTTFKVTQGMIIGYAGNSGSSGGPHLHFEARNSKTQVPLNPFTYNIVDKPQDNVFPLFRKVFVYSQVPFEDIYTTKKRQVATAISLGKGKFKLSKDTIEIEPRSYFGFDVLDYTETGGLRTGIHGLRLSLNGKKMFEYEVNAFAFDKTRYCNYLIDFDEKQKHNINVIQTYRLPNNLLPVYHTTDDGIITLPFGQKAKVDLELWDHANNISKLSFWVKSIVSQQHNTVAGNYVKIYPAVGGMFKSEGLLVDIPANALYEPVLLTVSKLPKTSQSISDVYEVHTTDVPLQKNIKLTFTHPQYKGDFNKITVYKQTPDGKIFSLSTTRTPYSITAYTTTFGTYFVGLDTVAPTVYSVNCKPNENMKAKFSVMLKAKDDVGSIGYYGTVDGKWALFEYDQKNDLFIYKFDPNYLTRNKKHKLVFTATDSNKNSKTFITDFYW